MPRQGERTTECVGKNSTYRYKKKNGHITHIYWVCSRFVALQLSKMRVYTEEVDYAMNL